MTELKKYKYRNVSDFPQELMSCGVVESGATIELNQIINNPNFQMIHDSDDKVGIETPPKKPVRK